MQFTYGTLVFRDFLNFSNPMSLDAFSRSCGITEESKTCFPYELYTDIAVLKHIKEFPAYPEFRSSLTRKTDAFFDELLELVTEKRKDNFWQSSNDVNEFFKFSKYIQFEFQENGTVKISADQMEIKKILDTSPRKFYESKVIFQNKCSSMADFLRLYNLNDVILLEKCVREYAKGFFETWKINIHQYMSLPGVAQGKFKKNFEPIRFEKRYWLLDIFI